MPIHGAKTFVKIECRFYGTLVYLSSTVSFSPPAADIRAKGREDKPDSTSHIFKCIPGGYHEFTGPPASLSTGLTNLKNIHRTPLTCMKSEGFKFFLRLFLYIFCLGFFFLFSLNDSAEPHSPSDLLPMSPSVYAVLREHLSPTAIESAVSCKLSLLK